MSQEEKHMRDEIIKQVWFKDHETQCELAFRESLADMAMQICDNSGSTKDKWISFCAKSIRYFLRRGFAPSAAEYTNFESFNTAWHKYWGPKNKDSDMYANGQMDELPHVEWAERLNS